MTPVSPVGGEVDVARLREVAEAAAGVIEGEWRGRLFGGEFQVYDDSSIIARMDDTPAWDFVASASPGRILALLDRLEAAESARDEALAAVERVRALADEWHNWATWEGSAGHRIRAALTPSAPTEETQA